MATSDDVVTQACDGALKKIRKIAPAEYAKLDADPAKKKQLAQAARATATECIELAAEFANKPKDIDKRIAKHLSEDRIKMIRDGLCIPTFRMDVIKKDDGKYYVTLNRDGKPFMNGTRDLSTVGDIDSATIEQYASILVECVLLVMSAVGLAPDVSGSVMEKTVKDVVEDIEESPELQNAIQKFVDSWKAANGNAWEMATAVFELIKDADGADILWEIIKSLCSEMAWYDWLETAVKVAAMIIAALATDGAALIGEIALIVLDAVDFARKIANIATLEEIRKTF